MQIVSSYPHPDFGDIEYPMMMENGVGAPAAAPRNWPVRDNHLYIVRERK